MIVEFKLPDLGENVESADVGTIHVKVGDVIEAEQIVVELETEKTVYELPCPYAGKVTRVHIKEGETISTGQVILSIEQTESAGAKASEPAAPAPAKNERDEVREIKPRAESDGAPAKPSAPAKAPAKAPSPAPDRAEAPPPAGPATRRLARELGVDLAEVRGSGPGGRISREDVKTHVQEKSRGGAGAASSVAAMGVAAVALPDFTKWGEVDRVRMNKLGQTAAANLSYSWATIPHVTQHELADITELEAARKRYMETAGQGSPKITMTVLLIKAVVAALKRYEKFNSSYDTAAQEIVLKRYYHIGIAVDTEHGLLVPVVRDADRKSIHELAVELTHLAEKARQRKLELAEMQGATFTISNLGGIAGTAFTPIINHPEVAILGVSRSRFELVPRGDKTETRFMLPLSLSYDHRVINGADGARFVRAIAETLSDPMRLLMEC